MLTLFSPVSHVAVSLRHVEQLNALDELDVQPKLLTVALALVV